MIVGNCGFGVSPIISAKEQMSSLYQVSKLDNEWKNFGEYFEVLDNYPTSINVGVLIGHHTIRRDALSIIDKNYPSEEELNKMVNLVEEGMESGCLGFSTGLVYEPGRNSKTEEIIELANQLASEHLSIASEKKVHIAEKINSAGSIFLGEISSEVLADYVAGPSHVMPTNGSARYSSSLSSRTFQKTIPVLAIDKDRFKEICNDAEKLAKLESLQAHSEAISVRKKNYFME